MAHCARQELVASGSPACFATMCIRSWAQGVAQGILHLRKRLSTPCMEGHYLWSSDCAKLPLWVQCMGFFPVCPKHALAGVATNALLQGMLCIHQLAWVQHAAILLGKETIEGRLTWKFSLRYAHGHCLACQGRPVLAVAQPRYGQCAVSPLMHRCLCGCTSAYVAAPQPMWLHLRGLPCFAAHFAAGRISEGDC